MPEIDSIYLAGFRAVGKSTIGPLLAQQLGWQFIDSDDLITTKLGKSAAEITDHGKNWLPFREAEHQAVLDLSQRRQIIVSTGGGLPVNDLFGQANTEIIQNNPASLLILLTAEDDIIEQRLRQRLMVDTGAPLRPALNQATAAEVSRLDRATQIERLVADSMKALALRKPLYAALTQNVIDTGVFSEKEVVASILNLI